MVGGASDSTRLRFGVPGGATLTLGRARPARLRSLPSSLAALFGRHTVRPSTTPLESALAAERDGSGIFPLVGVDGFDLARGLTHDLDGKLVHVGRALARALRHTLDGSATQRKETA